MPTVPFLELQKVFRNSGLLKDAADAIKTGQAFTPASRYDSSRDGRPEGNDTNVVLVPSASDPESIIAAADQKYRELLASGIPARDIQGLVGDNRTRRAGNL